VYPPLPAIVEQASDSVGRYLALDAGLTAEDRLQPMIQKTTARGDVPASALCDPLLAKYPNGLSILIFRSPVDGVRSIGALIGDRDLALEQSRLA
jgi:hypothetical protein